MTWKRCGLWYEKAYLLFFLKIKHINRSVAYSSERPMVQKILTMNYAVKLVLVLFMGSRYARLLLHFIEIGHGILLIIFYPRK
jgi:hypothetical protein